MLILSTNIIIPILVGAFLNLDKQVCGPFMIGRPLMVGFTLGLLTGEPQFGTWMGLSAELLWLAAMPLGGQLTPNAGLAVSAALTAWVGSGFGPAVGTYQIEAGLVLSFFTIPIWAMLFTFLDEAERDLVEPHLLKVKTDLEAGRDPRFFRRNLYGLVVTFGLSLAALVGAVIVNILFLRAAIRLAPDELLLNLRFLFTFIPFLGLLGMAVSLEKRSFNYFLGGLLASLLTLSAG